MAQHLYIQWEFRVQNPSSLRGKQCSSIISPASALFNFHVFGLINILRQIVNYSLFCSLLSSDHVNITTFFLKPRRRSDSHLTPILQARHWTWGCWKPVEWKMPGSIYLCPKICVEQETILPKHLHAISTYMFFTTTWIGDQMKRKKTHNPYHPCMVYLPTFGCFYW